MSKYMHCKRYNDKMPLTDVINLADDVAATLLKYHNCDHNITIQVILPEEIRKLDGYRIKDLTSLVFTEISTDVDNDHKIKAIRHKVYINARELANLRDMWSNHQWMIAYELKVFLSIAIGRYILMKNYIGTIDDGIMDKFAKAMAVDYDATFDEIASALSTPTWQRINTVVGLTIKDYAVLYANAKKVYAMDGGEEIFNGYSMSKYLTYDEYYTMCDLFESDNYDTPESEG